MHNYPLCRSFLFSVAFTSLLTLSGNADAAELNRKLEDITKQIAAGDPLVFATFGDSITLPCYHTDGRQNYITFTVDALRKAYPRANIKIVHAGDMGSTARGLDNTRFKRHVLDHHPDVVFIMFGMNDCGGGQPYLEEYDANLTALIKHAREAGALPIIATQNEIIYDSSDGRTRTALPTYMDRALEVARREGVLAVDCFADWKPLVADQKQLAARLNDWIHPNHAGHRLMAKSIVERLWPAAAQFVSIAERTPLKPEEENATDCLAPGPCGKQVLQTANGTWCCVTAQERDHRLTDIVFSYSQCDRPKWSDFRHIRLVGASDDAAFDDMDRTLTGAMLLESRGKLFVIFSWNVGVFMLSISEPPLDEQALEVWKTEAMRPESWLKHQSDAFIRPTIVANAFYRETAKLFDGYLQPNGWPAVFCIGRKLHEGGGFEIVDGIDGIFLITRPDPSAGAVREFLLPGGHSLNCWQDSNGTVFYAAQSAPATPLLLGVLPSQGMTATNFNVGHFLVAGGSQKGVAVAMEAKPTSSASSKWTKITWNVDAHFEKADSPAPEIQDSSELVPLLWWDEKECDCLWWHPSMGNEKLKFAYSAHVQQATRSLGVLSLRQSTLAFDVLPIRRPE